jgi:carboxyl-terminal processing protease
MKPSRTTLLPGIVLVLSVLTSGWFLQRGVAAESAAPTAETRVFEQVVSLVRSSFVDPVDEEAMYESAIEGILNDLEDPNTAFLEAPAADNLSIRTEGEYGGVGLEIVDRNGYVTVVTAMPGTPGTRAGIRAGDRIVEVNGESIVDKGSDHAVSLLRGAPGTGVRVSIERMGVDGAIPFEIERAVIVVHSVPFAVEIEPGIGYIPLQLFSETSPQEVRDALAELGGSDLDGVILDLRGNPGGVLEGGIEVADLFLDAGDPVVETRGRAPGQSAAYSASDPDRYPDLELAVLVDERSASASEIVAGALQDHDRGLVLGARTWGKGSVQSIYRLSGGKVLKLTTARWFTPSGRSIQKARDEQIATLDHGSLSLSGQLSSRPDDTERPMFESMGGRALVGGGGITPDVSVFPDTLTTEEQEAVRRLYREAGALSAALFDFAVQYVTSHPGLEPDFVVNDATLDELYDFLVGGAGLAVDRPTFEGVRRYLTYQLEGEIALRGFGAEGQFRRLRPYDPVLSEAVDALMRADGPADLVENGAGGPSPQTAGGGGGAG